MCVLCCLGFFCVCMCFFGWLVFFYGEGIRVKSMHIFYFLNQCAKEWLLGSSSLSSSIWLKFSECCGVGL